MKLSAITRAIRVPCSRMAECSFSLVLLSSLWLLVPTPHLYEFLLNYHVPLADGTSIQLLSDNCCQIHIFCLDRLLTYSHFTDWIHLMENNFAVLISTYRICWRIIFTNARLTNGGLVGVWSRGSHLHDILVHQVTSDQPTSAGRCSCFDHLQTHKTSISASKWIN